MAYFAFFSLNPPGTFYTESPDTNQAHLNSTYNWNCSINTIEFADQFARFREFKGESLKYYNMIVDI
jgi:hypothetical protein